MHQISGALAFRLSATQTTDKLCIVINIDGMLLKTECQNLFHLNICINYLRNFKSLESFYASLYCAQKYIHKFIQRRKTSNKSTCKFSKVVSVINQFIVNYLFRLTELSSNGYFSRIIKFYSGIYIWISEPFQTLNWEH